MTKLLIAEVRESVENPTVTGAFLMEKPEGEPPYEMIAFNNAEKITFDPPLGEIETEQVVEKLIEMGHDVETSQFFG